MVPNQHALLSASSAHRWMKCTPSAVLEAGIEDKSSLAAQQGTVAHALAEYKLRRFLGFQPNAPVVSDFIDAQMHECTEDYVSFVLEQLDKARQVCPDAKMLIEQRLDYSRWVPGGFGTGDCVIVAEPVLRVIDFKYGQGVKIDAQENPQMMLYALGALHMFAKLWQIESVEMTIFQPRCANVSSWTASVKDLYDWANNELRQAAELAVLGEGEFCPGAWCRFCKIASTCRVRAQHQMQIAKYEFASPARLEDSEIADVLARAGELSKWVSSVQEYALDQALKHGKHYPGFKVVASRSARKFSDETSVADKAKQANINPFERKLKSPTALEKQVGKELFNNIFADLVIKPVGKPTLVADSDPRPELNMVSAVDEFKKIKGEKNE